MIMENKKTGMTGHACLKYTTVLKRNALPTASGNEKQQVACSLRPPCPVRRRMVFGGERWSFF